MLNDGEAYLFWVAEGDRVHFNLAANTTGYVGVGFESANNPSVS